MNQSTIILLASARKESETLEVVEKIFIGKNIPCIDLLDEKISLYNYAHEYPADDGFYTIIERCLDYKNIIFATPIYWYSMSGILKIFFDRLTDIVTVEKSLGRKLAGKKMALIALGTDPEIPPGFEMPFHLTATYFNMHFLGFLYCCTKNKKHMELSPERVNEFLKIFENK